MVSQRQNQTELQPYGYSALPITDGINLDKIISRLELPLLRFYYLCTAGRETKERDKETSKQENKKGKNIDRDIIQRCETFNDIALILGYGRVRRLPNKNGLTTTDGVYKGQKKQIRITDARHGKIYVG